ncbi:MAG: hypothetical protein ACM34K_13640 [Bacillota bacterium]
MKTNQMTAIAGIILLFAGELIPLAKLGDSFISVIPVWNNLSLYNGTWEWRDISFFAVTLFLLAIISIWFMAKKKYKGLVFTGFIALFSMLVIFIAIFFIHAKLLMPGDISYIISWGWLFLIPGAIFLIASGRIKN